MGCNEMKGLLTSPGLALQEGALIGDSCSFGPLATIKHWGRGWRFFFVGLWKWRPLRLGCCGSWSCCSERRVGMQELQELYRAVPRWISSTLSHLQSQDPSWWCSLLRVPDSLSAHLSAGIQVKSLCKSCSCRVHKQALLITQHVGAERRWKLTWLFWHAEMLLALDMTFFVNPYL